MNMNASSARRSRIINGLMAFSLLITTTLTVSPVFTQSSGWVQAAEPASQQQPQAAPSNQTSGQPVVPVVVDGGDVTVFDLPNSSAESMKIEIAQGRFGNQSVGHLTMEATGIDFRNGVLNGLAVKVNDGHFSNVLADELALKTGGFSFNTFELLNHRRFILAQPVQGTVSLKISEKNMNAFLSDPKTIRRIEKSIAKRTGNLKVVSFRDPEINFLGGNKVRFAMVLVVGEALGMPMALSGKIGLNNGKLAFSDLHVDTGSTQLPPDIDKTIESKLNEALDWEKLISKGFVIKGKALNISKRTLYIDGDVTLNRLEFGKS